MPELITIIQFGFGFMGMTLLWSFAFDRKWGLLLGGLCYLSGSVASQVYSSWWPIVIAFVAAWGLRLLGFDEDAKA